MKLSLLRSQPGRALLFLLLAAGCHAAAAQSSPPLSDWKVEPGALIYLDGQPSTLVAINQLPSAAIACSEFRLGAPGILRVFGDTVATEALVLTTKAHENAPVVLALADRANLRSAYRWEPGSVRDIAPRALAYITSHYPKAWLDGQVQQLTRKSTGDVKYQVRLADNWGWRLLCFTAEGDFVDDQTY